MDEDAIAVTSYLRERQRAGHSPGRDRAAGEALTELYARRPVAASVLLRGVDGYGLAGPPGDGPSRPDGDPPLTVVAVDTRPRVDAVLGEAAGLTRPGLITLERVRLLSGDIGPLWPGGPAPETAQLTIYCTHADRVYQVPAYEAACELLYRRGVAGATVLSGADGPGGRRQRAGFLSHGIPHQGAGAPLLVVAVGDGGRIAALLPELGGLFRHPLMTVTPVQVRKRGGRPADVTETPSGMTALVKLTVYTSEAARHDGQPAHRAIVQRLSSTGISGAGISGAVSHRGFWGFSGDHEPHGDHFPLHGRHSPVVTTVIATPDRAAAALDVIGSLTGDRGLVTAETVLTPQPATVASHRTA